MTTPQRCEQWGLNDADERVQCPNRATDIIVPEVAVGQTPSDQLILVCADHKHRQTLAVALSKAWEAESDAGVGGIEN